MVRFNIKIQLKLNVVNNPAVYSTTPTVHKLALHLIADPLYLLLFVIVLFPDFPYIMHDITLMNLHSVHDCFAITV